MLNKIQFQPNVPVLVALKYADGKLTEGRFGDQMYYTFTEDRCAYLDLDIAAKINLLGMKVGEPFEICKYWSGKKGEKPQWDVRRPQDVPSTAPPAVDGATQTHLEQQLAASIHAVAAARSTTTAAVGQTVPSNHNRQRPAIAPGATAPLGNGHNPGELTPQAADPTAPNGSIIPLKIPMDVAFGEILTWMQQALNGHHIQWNDAAQQDFASTALIGGMREGWISPWRRRAA